ncbi:restriction endonuclease subunit S [Micromonospora echinaurantiaca]|uniref:restriction endonuclease subunit S n=1 Tax=Micromonospora echinaurantiaca TaxID=47857 RepID=UPI003710B93C
MAEPSPRGGGQRERLGGFSPLSETCTIRLGWSTAASETGYLPLVRSSDIASGEIDWQKVPYCRAEPPNLDEFLIRDGDVLLARTGASVGNLAYVADPPRAVCASYILRLRPTKDWHGLYLAHYLQSPEGQREIRRRAEGAAIVNLSSKRLSSLPIPHAPYQVQVHLAQRLSQLKKTVVSASERLKRIERQIAWLRAQTSDLAYERVLGPSYVAARATWPKNKIAEITINRDNRRVPMKASERAERRGVTPYYGASGVIDHVEGQTHNGRYLLVSEDGNNLSSRRTSIAFVSYGPIWANNHVHVLECRGSVSPEYLAFVLNHTDLRRFLTGTVQPKLTKAALAGLTVAIPDAITQESLVEAAEDLEGTCDALQATIVALGERLRSTWQSILFDAFSAVAYGREPRIMDSATTESPLEPILTDIADLQDSGEFSVDPEDSVPASAGHADELSTAIANPATIAEALLGRQEGCSPEHLFRILTPTLERSGDPIDAFYDMLKHAVASGIAEEVRNGDDIRIVAVSKR